MSKKTCHNSSMYDCTYTHSTHNTCSKLCSHPTLNYCATRTHSADYAVTRCLSVRLSVTRRYICLNDYVYPRSFFPIEKPHHSSLFRTKRDGNIPTGTPNVGSNVRGYEKSRFSTNISLYLGNDVR